MKKYRQYLLPSVLTSLALALNEFVDCMIVSNLLGNDALAAANLGCPVILMIAALYVLLGSGGAILYALYLGRWETEKAGKCFRMSLYLSIASGLLFLAVGNLFSAPIVSVLCPDEVLRETFSVYYSRLLLTAPVLTTMLTLVCFLPPSGAPVAATAINIVSNGVNLVMDYVYIRICGMGIEGAAYATITGYLIGAVIVIIMLISKKVKITDSKVTFKDLGLIPKIAAQGAATAMLQVCFAIKYAISNGYAYTYGGNEGVVAFSLCLQTFSIASVFLLGVADTAQPLLAMLSGQRDFGGERRILVRSLRLQILFSVLLVAFFEIVPQAVAAAYKVSDPQILELAVSGVRIFSLTYLTRSLCIQFMRYVQVEQKKLYALFISLFDGMAVLPLGALLCGIIGIKGLFWSYSLASLLLLFVIIIVNFVMLRKSPDKYADILLIRKDVASSGQLSITISDDPQDISAASEKMIDYCTENELSMKQAFRVGLLCEEMSVYTQNHREENGEIDILLRICENELILNFRSIGKPFNPLNRTDDDIPENVLVLQKTASDLAYDYIMGMNSTRIVIERT